MNNIQQLNKTGNYYAIFEIFYYIYNFIFFFLHTECSKKWFISYKD